MFVLEFI